MSSWLSVLACWWLSFCFTSSSPVATLPKTSYSSVTNVASNLSQPGNMFPNTLTLQVNLCAATFCTLISTFPELSHETRTCEGPRLWFLVTFSKLLRLIRLRRRVAVRCPPPLPGAQRPSPLRRSDLGPQSPNRSVYSFHNTVPATNVTASRKMGFPSGAEGFDTNGVPAAEAGATPSASGGDSAVVLKRQQCARHVSMTESRNPPHYLTCRMQEMQISEDTKGVQGERQMWRMCWAAFIKSLRPISTSWCNTHLKFCNTFTHAQMCPGSPQKMWVTCSSVSAAAKRHSCVSAAPLFTFRLCHFGSPDSRKLFTLDSGNMPAAHFTAADFIFSPLGPINQ